MKVTVTAFKNGAFRFFALLKIWGMILLQELWTRHLFLYASAISFNILLLILPLIFLLLSAASYSLSSQDVYSSASQLIGTLLALSDGPDAEHNLFLERVASVLASFKISRRLVGGSIIALVVLSYYLYLLLRSIVNELWDLRDWESIVHGTLRGLLIFGCVGGLLFSLLLATIVVGLIVQRDVTLPAGLDITIAQLAPITPALAPIALTIMGFSLFLLLPFERVSMRVIAVSSVTFGIIWELCRLVLVNSLIQAFPNLDSIYGSLALLVIAASSLYYTSFAFVLSAVVGYSFERASASVQRMQSKASRD